MPHDSDQLEIRHHIANCDAIEGMRLLPESSVDVVITSPPYNIGTKYLEYKDQRNRSDYLQWTRDWTGEVHRVLKPTGSFFLNLSGPPSDRRFPHEVLSWIYEWGFELQNEIHWIKSIAIDGIQKGHYKPINSEAYLNCCHEYLFHFTPKGNARLDRLAVGVAYADRSNETRWTAAAAGVHCAGNVWFVPYKTVTRKDGKFHPAAFPVELPTRCLKLVGLPKGPDRARFLVLDPFVGSGSTILAAALLSLPAVGFDIDREYVEMAAKRVHQETGWPVGIGSWKK